MGFKMGIVGLPNVGKSTLFNALTRTAAAQAANFPFCTIEPNVGEVAMPEPRLDKLAAIAKSKEIIPTRMNFVDIAGGTRINSGPGLGNQVVNHGVDHPADRFVNQAPARKAGMQGAHFLEEGASDGARVGQRPAHPDRLTSLPRKDESAHVESLSSKMWLPVRKRAACWQVSTMMLVP